MDEEKFPILVFKKEGTFHGIIKELRIVESSENISELFELLQKRRTEVLERLRRANLEELLLPEPSASKKRLPLTHFIVLMFFIMIPVVWLMKPLGTVLYRCADMMKGSLPQKIISFNESLQTMPLERKEEIRNAIHQILVEIKPLSDEVATVWNDPILQDRQNKM
ncbi:MAG TPA: hypothetical protein VLE95_04325 [Chlamydiales bacterium]|nr:hypothetical protein [Chlamydiales bacterium]